MSVPTCFQRNAHSIPNSSRLPLLMAVAWGFPKEIVHGCIWVSRNRAFVPHQGFCPSSCLKVRANLLLCAPQVLCASNDAHDQVEPILPPEGVPVGEKISFEGWANLEHHQLAVQALPAARRGVSPRVSCQSAVMLHVLLVLRHKLYARLSQVLCLQIRCRAWGPAEPKKEDLWEDISWSYNWCRRHCKVQICTVHDK